MKRIFHFTLAGLAWLAALASPQARAWTYSDGDVLLIFRETGSDDVEFDIGNISQFTNPSSSTTHVTDWSLSLVNDTFGSVSGASVILVATTPSTASTLDTWLTGSASVTSVSDVTHTGWSELYAHINGIGVDPVSYDENTAGANGYVIAETGATGKGQTSDASYYYVVTDAGVDGAFVQDFGGNVPFDVEGVAPATIGFWQIQPSTTIPKPEATYLGTFDIDANGQLYFYTGSLVPKITSVTHHGASDTVSFTTLANGSYSLVYSPDASVPVSQWAPLGVGPVSGNGGTQSLTFTSPGDTADFYAVVRSP
jgi:hypothetical protein